MFTALTDLLRKTFSSSTSNVGGEDVVYFGGLEEPEIGQNELPFSLYIPSSDGRELIYLPYYALEDDTVAALRDMEIGEAFKIVEEDDRFDMGGEVIKLERIDPKRIVRIEGLETNHPDAPIYPVMKLL